MNNFAVEIDTALASNYKLREDALMRKFSAQESLKRAEERTFHYGTTPEEYRTRIAELEHHLAVLAEIIKKLEASYTGWSRAYLVSNSNGHIHKSQNCVTCFDSTRYVWLTAVSGEDELRIAELAGEKACTICYSHAPSAYFLRECGLEDPSVVEARAERELKKAEREAKRIATGIWNPDGTPLMGYEYGFTTRKSEIKNERTAQTIAVDLMVGIEGQRRDELEKERSRETIEDILIALAHKRGTSVEEQRALVSGKAHSKIIRNAREHARWLADHPEYAK